MKKNNTPATATITSNRFLKSLMIMLIIMSSLSMMSFALPAELAQVADTNTVANDSNGITGIIDAKAVTIDTRKTPKTDKGTVAADVTTTLDNDLSMVNASNTLNNVVKTADNGLTDRLLSAAAPRVDRIALEATDNLTSLMVNHASLSVNNKAVASDASINKLFQETFAPAMPSEQINVDAIFKNTDQLTNTLFKNHYGIEVVRF